MEECDGLIYTSSSAYEPESIEATRQWLAGSGNRGLYAIGPMVPSTMGIKPSNAAMLREMAVLENEDGFPEFMDNMLAKHGESSLIYVCRFNQFSQWNLNLYAMIVDVLWKFVVAHGRTRQNFC